MDVNFVNIMNIVGKRMLMIECEVSLQINTALFISIEKL